MKPQNNPTYEEYLSELSKYKSETNLYRDELKKQVNDKKNIKDIEKEKDKRLLSDLKVKIKEIEEKEQEEILIKI